MLFIRTRESRLAPVVTRMVLRTTTEVTGVVVSPVVEWTRSLHSITVGGWLLAARTHRVHQSVDANCRRLYMNSRTRSITAPLAVVCAIALTAWLQAVESSLPTGQPEEVGLSSGRLARINELIQRHINAGDISGAVTLVARRGRIAHLEAHGTTALEGGTPTAKDSVFRIASMTKVITGVAVMMMVEEGKLRVTDPVSLYIPEFKNLEVAVEHSGRGEGNSDSGSSFDTVLADREVTVRDLLTHTSGLVSGPMSNASERPIAQQPGDTLADYVPRLGQTVLEFQPGFRPGQRDVMAADPDGTAQQVKRICLPGCIDQGHQLRVRVLKVTPHQHKSDIIALCRDLACRMHASKYIRHS